MAPSPLDDPARAGFAWQRYKRMMRRMGAGTLVVVVLALAYVYHELGLVSIHLYIATALGVGFAALLTAGLMGLVFLSNGTGHDAAAGGDSSDQDGGESR